MLSNVKYEPIGGMCGDDVSVTVYSPDGHLPTASIASLVENAMRLYGKLTNGVYDTDNYHFPRGFRVKVEHH